jgi:hypothetical protein
MTTTDVYVPKTYQEAVDYLVKCHAEAHDYMKDLEIFLIPDSTESVVQLLEISNGYPDTNDIWPIKFRKSNAFPFGSAVASATPDEWKRLLAGTLDFQCNWDLSTRKRVWPK